MKKSTSVVLMLLVFLPSAVYAPKGGKGGQGEEIVREKGIPTPTPTPAPAPAPRPRETRPMPTRAVSKGPERPMVSVKESPRREPVRPLQQEVRQERRAPAEQRPTVTKRAERAERPVTDRKAEAATTEKAKPSEQRPGAERQARKIDRVEGKEQKGAKQAGTTETTKATETPKEQPKTTETKGAKQEQPGAARTEKQARGVPTKPLTKEQQQELASKPAVSSVNRLAEQQIAQDPKLKAEVNQISSKWRTDQSMQQRWYNDWNHYSHYHSYNYFHFDTFVRFVFFAPWYVFPFYYYSDFYAYYPVYWVPFGWFSYPVYWNYGYAYEIGLVGYIERENFDDAIDRLEQRLDILENKALEQSRVGAIEGDVVVLRASISEIVWLLNDLKTIIIDKARISREHKDRLINRINAIKDRGHGLMGYFKEGQQYAPSGYSGY